MRIGKEGVVAAVFLLLAAMLYGVSVWGTGNPAPAELECLVSDTKGTTVAVQEHEGTSYLFLPSSADVTRLTLRCADDDAVLRGNRGEVRLDGKPVDLTALAEPEDTGEYAVQLVRQDSVKSITVMQSANLRSVYLSSETAQYNQEWLDSSANNRAKGSMALLTADGETVYSGGLTQIRVRGNTTAMNDKKPYQIKLQEASDLLSTGDEANESKTWLLIANYSDATLMQNKVIYDLAQELGLAYTTECEFVDLYYDGKYCGNYLLCEKLEMSDGRIEVDGLGELTDNLNQAQGNLDAIPSEEKELDNGVSIRYVPLNGNPEDNSGGYLFEMEVAYRYPEEQAGFCTAAGQHFVIKNPAHATEKQVTYISSLWQQVENAAEHGGTDPESGKSIDELIDIRSLAQVYLMNELAKNGDGFSTSTFFYKKAGEDKLYAGPVWDFDISCGIWYNKWSGYLQDPEGILTGALRLPYQLLQMDSVWNATTELYREEWYPVIRDILLGDQDAQGTVLHSIAYYEKQLEASQAMNYKLWPMTRTTYTNVYPAWGGDTFAGNVAYLREFLSKRSQWLYQEFGKQRADWQRLPDDVPASDRFLTDYLTIRDNGWLDNESEAMFGADSDAVWSDLLTVLYCSQTGGDAGTAFADKQTWLREQGVSVRFGADDTLTREQLAQVLYEYAGQPEGAFDGLNGAADADAVSEPCRNAVSWAASNGILRTEETQVLPQRTVTRSEGCTMILEYKRIQEAG